VTQLRDESSDTYWQSDGPQPHLINIHFSRRKAVCEVAFYLDFNLDESYTPKRIGIKAGITHHDLEEVKVVELHEPVGWVSVPLFAELDPLDDDIDDIDGGNNIEGNGEDENEASANAVKRRKPLRTFLLQICVLSMHQNGRDVHVRQVKIFGPRTTAGEASEIRASSGGTVTSHSLGMPRFQTVEMTQFAIR
jgi:anaphase-promoting complex subunit 10